MNISIVTKIFLLLATLTIPSWSKAIDNEIKKLANEDFVDNLHSKKEQEEEKLEEKKAKKLADEINKHCPSPGTVIADEILCINSQDENIKRLKAEHREIEDGDLIEPLPLHRRRRVAIYKKWPTNKDGFVNIPYVFEVKFSNVTNAFMQAVQEYNRVSCVRFIPRTNETNYIAVISDFGCYAYPGMVGGRQALSLQAFTGCAKKGTAIHEMMHVLGFLHTMSRRDRDEHITVHINDIVKSLRRQFAIHAYGAGFIFGVPYDKHSVMHYGNRAGAYGGKFSMTSKSDPKEKLGQLIGFTRNDIEQINRLYCPKYATMEFRR